MNKKGYSTFEDLFKMGAVMLIILFFFSHFFGFSNNEIVYINKTPIQSVTELQENFDTCLEGKHKIEENLEFCKNIQPYEDINKLQKKLNNKDTILITVTIFSIIFMLGLYVLGYESARKRFCKKKK